MSAPLLDRGRWQGRIFSTGWVPGSGGEYDSVEPATGQALARVGAASAVDVAKAAEPARRAQLEWAALPYDHRTRVLRRRVRLFEDHGDEIDEWLVRESGATRPFARCQIGPVTAEECYEAAALAAHPYGELLRSNQPRLSMACVPVGVVGVISPFNAPVILSIRAIAPAPALGNAVLVKPDPRTAVCGGVVPARVCEEAELAEGLFHLLPGGAEVGAALVDHTLVRVIAFTGSTRAGRKVAAAAGIASDYAAAPAEHAARLPVGDPARADVAVGPIIDAGQRDHIHEIMTGSVEAGAKPVTGGTFDGLFYQPTVLTDVAVTAPAYAEEIFGPAAPVVPFSTVDEAVKLTGGTEYGLSLGVPTRDVTKGLALAERIPSGFGARERPAGERRGARPVRRGRRLRHGLAPRPRASERRGVHRNAVGHRAR